MGPSGTFSRLKDTLPKTIDNLIITHIDSDHIRGAIDLLAAPEFQVKRIFFNYPLQSINTAQDQALASQDLKNYKDIMIDGIHILSITEANRFISLANDKGIPIISMYALTSGRDMGPGILNLNALGPSTDNLNNFQQAIIQNQNGGRIDSAIVNSASIIFNAVNIELVNDTDSITNQFLFTGDANNYGNKRDIEEALGIAGRLVDKRYFSMLKVPHHGSSVTTDGGFYTRVRANIYLISGKNQSHPSYETLEWILNHRANDEHISFYVTNRNDNVVNFINNYHPSANNYSFFEFNNGAIRMDFRLENGVVSVPGTSQVFRIGRVIG